MSTGDVATPFIGRVKKNAAACENAVRFCDEGGDPAHVVVLGQWSFESCYAVVDVSSNGISPMAIVRGVDRVFRRVLGNRDFRDCEPEHTGVAVKSENVHTIAEGQCQGSLRPVDKESGGDLVLARPQKMLFRSRRFDGCRENREYRPDRNRSIDNRGVVNRINCNNQRSGWIQNEGAKEFLRENCGDRRAPKRIDEHLLRENVNLLLDVAVGVLGPDGGADPSPELSKRNDPRDFDRVGGYPVNYGPCRRQRVITPARRGEKRIEIKITCCWR